MTEANYSSVVAYMLDRDDQTTKPMMLYPVTRIEFKEFTGNAIVTVRIFVVDENGKWVEAV